MAKSEIEKKVEEYCKKECGSYYYECYCECSSIEAFQEGAKWGMEHAVEWHDLRKDPNDLPKDCEKVMFVTKGEKETLTGTFKNGGEGTIIFDTFGIAYYDVEQVIAWCKLPQFKE